MSLVPVLDYLNPVQTVVFNILTFCTFHSLMLYILLYAVRKHITICCCNNTQRCIRFTIWGILHYSWHTQFVSTYEYITFSHSKTVHTLGPYVVQFTLTFHAAHPSATYICHVTLFCLCKINLLLSSQLCLNLPSFLFSWGFQNIILCTYVISPSAFKFHLTLCKFCSTNCVIR